MLFMSAILEQLIPAAWAKPRDQKLSLLSREIWHDILNQLPCLPSGEVAGLYLDGDFASACPAMLCKLHFRILPF